MNNIQNIYNKVSSSSKVLMLSALLCASSSVLAQEQVLKGRIVNSQGEPIPGAVVNVAEESRIALTDKEGYFTLKKVTPSDEICVSSVGYKNAQEKVTTFDGTYVIKMEDDADEYEHLAPVPSASRKENLDRFPFGCFRRGIAEASCYYSSECLHLNTEWCGDLRMVF